MNKYKIHAVINGKNIMIKKTFDTRIKAIDYMLDFYEKNYVFNFQLTEENQIAKHNIEYVATNYNRFMVSRI